LVPLFYGTVAPGEIKPLHKSIAVEILGSEHWPVICKTRNWRLKAKR